jgi:hypothetical protein
MGDMRVRIERKGVQRTLATAVAVLLALDLARIALRYGAGVTQYQLTLVNVTWEGNLPTWFSTMLLAASAALLFVIARVKMARRDRYRWHWAVLGAGFAAMSLDEAASIHEGLNALIRQTGAFDDRLAYPWVVAAMPFVGVVGIAFLPFLRSLDATTRRSFVTSAALYVGGAVGVETLWSAYVVTASLSSVGSQLLRNLTEGLEMAGAVLFIGALVGCLARDPGRPGLSFADDRSDRHSPPDA